MVVEDDLRTVLHIINLCWGGRGTAKSETMPTAYGIAELIYVNRNNLRNTGSFPARL